MNNSAQQNYFKPCDFHNITDFRTILNALLDCNRNMLFLTWQVLESQLSQVDPTDELEVYNALNERAAILFDAWILFRYTGV